MTNSSFITLLHFLLPPVFFSLARKILPQRYGWFGNYPAWSEALAESTTYQDQNIVQKVLKATLAVKQGKAVFERDSVLFDQPEINSDFLLCLLYLVSLNHNRLNVIDFGGSLGSTYWQYRDWFSHLKKISWNVVEQTHFIKLGKAYIATSHLHFYNDIASAIKGEGADVLLFNSVLQYLEDPWTLLRELPSQIKYILIDKTSFSLSNDDRLTKQVVSPDIYEASYPCWFFSEQRLFEALPEFEILYEYQNSEIANIPSQFKGYLLARKK